MYENRDWRKEKSDQKVIDEEYYGDYSKRLELPGGRLRYCMDGVRRVGPRSDGAMGWISYCSIDVLMYSM